MTSDVTPSENPKPVESTSARPINPQDGVWVKALTNECLDDVVLPPGGGSRRKPDDVPSENLRYIPRPDFLSHEGRDLRIDMLRGYFVFSMIVDHVRGPSPLYLLTGGNRFYTSAAEGFILTSGLVAGVVYQRLIRRDGLGPSLYKVLKRAFSLYLLTVGLTLLFILFSELLNLPWAYKVDLKDPLGLVLTVLTVHRTYYLVDVMALYTVLFLVSPLAFILLDRGKTWILLLGSALIYILYQFYPDYISLPWTIQANYLFNFSSWQILFFFGMALGFHQHRLPVIACRATRNGLLIAGAATLAIIALFYLVDPPTSLTPSFLAGGSPIPHETRLWIDKYLFDKMNLRPGRLVVSAVVFTFLFFAITHFWHQFKKITGWLLLPLGQYALNAYTGHIVMVGIVGLVLKPYQIPYPGPEWLNASIQVVSVLIIWFVLVRGWFSPTPKTSAIWNASPAIISVVTLVVLYLLPVINTPPAVASQPSGTDQVTPIPLNTVNRVTTPMPTPQPGMTAIVLPGTDRVASPDLGDLNGVLREKWFHSTALDRDMPVYIYFPPDYETSDRRYPVLYMLHGRGGNREDWVKHGLISIADQEFTTGNLRPMILVLPQGESGYWSNHAGNGPRWGDYIYDIVNYVDNNYRTIDNAESRAIGGLSMGAWGALHHAFRRPDVFSVVGAHSPSFRPDDGSIGFLGRGEEYSKKDPMTLAANQPLIDRLQIWVDTGELDTWADRALQFHQRLLARGVMHIWQVYPGSHESWYWHEHALDYIRFYGLALMKR